MPKMKDRMERLAIMPFSMGCVSHASIDVAEERPRRSKLALKSPSSRYEEDEEEDRLSAGESMKHSSRFMAIPKPNLTNGVNKLVRGFKSLSQLFAYEDEMEELGMEIGCPTNVKHVTHIGWDGSATKSDDTNPVMRWNHIFTSEILPSVSPEHFEFPTPATEPLHSPSPLFPSANSSGSTRTMVGI